MGFVEEGLESLAGVITAVGAVHMVLFEGAGSHLAVLDVPEGASVLDGAAVTADVFERVLSAVYTLESVGVAPFHLSVKHYGSEIIVVVPGGLVDVTVGADDAAAPDYLSHHVTVKVW